MAYLVINFYFCDDVWAACLMVVGVVDAVLLTFECVFVFNNFNLSFVMCSL